MTTDSAFRRCLPDTVAQIIDKHPNTNEIRMRVNCPLCLTIDNRNIICNYVTSKEDIKNSLTNFCKGSVYSFSENINQGFITFEGGYRIGISGKAVLEKNEIINVSDIKSLNIRIPNKEIIIPKEFLSNLPYEKSILIYSPPNLGKTTLLKTLATKLGSPQKNKRVVVIDCKNEIYSPTLHKGCSIDFFTNYPKSTAIDLAVRNMSPQYIICDEIGLREEVESLIECRNSGVNLICSAHASSIEELLKRDNINKLHQAGVFDGYAGIKRNNHIREYTYCKREDIKC